MIRVSVLCAMSATAAASFLVATPAQAGNCRDPWITQAIREVTGREPNGSYESGECTYTQYRGGSWSNYAELKTAVQAKFLASSVFAQPQQFAAPATATVRVDQAATRNVDGKIQFYANGKWYWLVGNDGASLIGNDSAGVVPTNAGNILSNANAALRARGY